MKADSNKDPKTKASETAMQHRTHQGDPGKSGHMNDIKGYMLDARIGYFSMEIALQSDIPTYSGGLGVLAGDTLRSAADLGLPMVGITLVSHAGYFRQEIDDQGRQIEHPDTWDCASHAFFSRQK